MRVSVDLDDPGYVPVPWPCRIYLDDVEQVSVVTADEEAGFVLRHVLTDEGYAQLDPQNPSQAWTETVTGKVRIEARAE